MHEVQNLNKTDRRVIENIEKKQKKQRKTKEKG